MRHLHAISDSALSDFNRRWLPTTLRRAASLLELYLPPSEHIFDGPTIRDLRALADELEAALKEQER